MTKRNILAIVGIVLILGVFSYYKFGKESSQEKVANIPVDTSTSTTTTTTPTTTSSQKGEMTTKYFGNRVDADFNGDGKVDSAFIITQTGGGSGTFFYLAHTLGGEAIFLGDRIAPQTTEWRNGEVVVNYADRKPGEPMTTKPSVGVSRYFKAVGKDLVEIKNTQTSTKTTGFLTGHVTTSPTCPVESIPPAPNCAPRAYVTEISAVNKSSGTIAAKTTTNAEGLYKIELPSGSYTITTKGGSVYPRCADKDIAVQENKTVTLDISCDSGIR